MDVIIVECPVMATSKATTVKEYLASLPADRRADVEKVRKVVNANLPGGFEEGMQYGMIGWYIPMARYPHAYNGQPLAVCNLAAQKNYMALYLMTVYGHAATSAWFHAEYKKSGKKLDMGKSCLRFKTADDIPLDLIGKLIARVSPEQYIAFYEAVKGPPKTKAKAKKSTPRDRPAARKRPAPARRAAKRG